MPVEHSPKARNATITDLPPEDMAPPADGDCYTKDEVLGMSAAHCQPDRAASSDDVGDLTVTFQQLLTGQPSQQEGRSKMETNDKPVIPGVVPPVASQALALHQETNVSKVLKGWPKKDCPKFTGAVGKDAQDWLVTMSVLLGDCKAHPGLWHIAAGQRLSGKAFRDHKDAALAGTRPTDWVSFQSWLIRLSPLGPTPESVADELEKLKEGPRRADLLC
ncbi:hypothetical protein PCANC_20282 [Puccinia coronata f. sp. avenae]|uniref:Uncharacterized protein n=1 Tax=Puccinia coronata f. sp. avenae TaxID=200324 RepID=A0A2N5SL14_9BASI|nr:hypothetical protein PCANC_20282 [Puccinia coronata f. sp. avenae]